MAPPLLSAYIRQRRYTAVRPFLTDNMLDIGCGHAYLAELLPSLERYVGVDLSAPMLGEARVRFPQHQFLQLDLEREPLPPELLTRPFRTITLIALLEHLAQPERVLLHLAQALSPGGTLIATTPTPLGHRIHRLGAQAGMFYREAAEDHKSKLDRRSLTTMCEAAGLNVHIYRQFEFGCNQLVVASR